MKKYTISINYLDSKPPTKDLHHIKKVLTNSLFTIILCLISTFSFAQNTKVTLNKQNTRLETVMNEIEKQTGLLFMYGKEVNTNQQVSIAVKDQSLTQVLDLLFKGKSIDYTLKGKHITLSPKKNTSTGNQPQKPPVSTKKRITGKVIDVSGKPVPNANILEVGTTNRSFTNEYGNFTISVAKNASIKVSYIGFVDQTLPVADGDEYDITLLEDSKALNELVVTGYQTVNKRDVTGSIATVKMADIYMPNFASIDKMLQGVVPGMIVNNSSSRVGSSPSIQIRGTSTLLGDASPLWVVDGIIQEDPIKINAATAMSDDMKNIIGNQVSWLNPQDIETITVLKDASATAIYGSKASNGVILVTTKQAKGQNIMSVNYTGSLTINSKPNYGQFNLMNSQERIQFSDEVFASGTPYLSIPFNDYYSYEGVKRLYIEGFISADEFAKKRSFLETVNTNWFDLLTRTGIDQNHNLSFSGGNERINFTSSLGYSRQQGQEIGNDFERLSGRVGVGFQLSPKLKLNVSIIGAYNEIYGFGTGVNPIEFATKTSRAIPAFDEFGNPVSFQRTNGYSYNKLQQSLSYNIINERDNSNSLTQNSRIAASADLKYTILPWLSYNFIGGYNYSSNFMSSTMAENTYYIGNRYRGYDYGTALPNSEYFNAAQLPFGGEYFNNDALQSSYNLQNLFRMSWTLKSKNRLNVLVGHELRSGTSISTANTVWGYSKERGEAIVAPTLPVNLIPTSGTTLAYPGFGILNNIYNGRWSRFNQTNNFMSVFATAAYSIANKYVINSSVRNDFSNRFGQDINKRLDPTYSLGVSWRVSEEKFIKNNIPQITQFNIRATYGIQGNALTNESPELMLNKQGLKPLFNQYFSTINRISNPNLSWERTTNWNFGADLLLFGKINFVADYYSRRSNAVLVQQIPYEFGIVTTSMNGGIIKNRGLEATVSFSPINTQTTGFSVSFNASKNWNTTGPSIGVSTLGNYLNGRAGGILKEGYPVNSFWSYSFAGLNPTNGNAQFNLLDADPAAARIDPSIFLVNSGESIPSITSGLNMNFRYKSFSLGTGFAMILGGKTRLDNPYANFSAGLKLPPAEFNVNKNLINRWKKPGDELTTNIPSINPTTTVLTPLPNGSSGYLTDFWALSDAMVVDASFLRFRNLDLTYRFKNKALERLKMKNLALTGSANNLFVIASKRFNGMDPELKNSVMPKSFTIAISCGL
ncbi:SusC/RagA family TonB-linked outer membrane protein [Pedobacter cryotolerans]|uniref:SusC/RagA family TonB-linked outer membrane protein n=1 Tax=Pedobacter cryotolerans TaxID=2571270 RepID=A0A4V6WMW1_9SPHI|nr:SusC/RagA family TonB-linked outer membrane protein [Pedobacter cryotolerans]TKB97200.1 SusC/RagA family TonB-linked outer membrane protein [Pedobacter cryotolerans]